MNGRRGCAHADCWPAEVTHVGRHGLHAREGQGNAAQSDPRAAGVVPEEEVGKVGGGRLEHSRHVPAKHN